MVNGVGFVMDPHNKGLVVLPVREARKTEEPGNVGGRRIAAILRGQGTQQRFRMSCVEAFDAPDHLMFSGRGVENEVRWRHVAGSADGLKRSAGFLVEVEISVAYLADLFFGPASRPFSYWIHSDEYVGTGLVLLVKPRLKVRACDCFGRKNSLGYLVPSSIPDKHRNLITWVVKSKHVFLCR
jgi:hypothetical protein